MQITRDRDERRRQKELLKAIYPDYDPKLHDAFVMRYTEAAEKKALADYMKARQITEPA